MASELSFQSRVLLFASLVTLCLFWFETLEAKEAEPLPDHVIKEFGKPPAIPKGPLSKELQAAVKAAFIDSMKASAWGRDQTIALDEIAGSKDPRLAWIISDLMRFVPGRQLNAALADAASKVLGKELKNENHWGGGHRSSHGLGYSSAP